MGTLLEPLLWRNIRQTHTSPTNTHDEVDFDLPVNLAIILLGYEVAIENPITVSGIHAVGLSLDPDTTPTTIPLFGADDDTVQMAVFEAELSTQGLASQKGYHSYNFPFPGLLIADNPSVHYITVGSAVVQAVLHRLWYKFVRLSDVEAAGLIIRRRRQ